MVSGDAQRSSLQHLERPVRAPVVHEQELHPMSVRAELSERARVQTPRFVVARNDDDRMRHARRPKELAELTGRSPSRVSSATVAETCDAPR